MTTETDALWAAVDSLTKPSTRRLARTDDQTAVAELQEAVRAAADPAAGRCNIAAYRNAQRALGAAAVSHGTIPSLWEQAEIALMSSGETTSGHRSPLATRTPADLNLMETMADIREAVSLQIQGRNEKPVGSIPDQIRHLAALVLPNEKFVEWWTFRFAQWQRILETYLQAVEGQPRPVRLRGVACKECKATHVEQEIDGELRIVGAVVVDFHDGLMRCAQCQACGWTEWRGEGLLLWAESWVGQRSPVMNIARMRKSDADETIAV